jgi:hypothetical protein
MALVGIAISMLSSCSIFQSRVNDDTRVLRTVPHDAIWDLDLYELHLSNATDTLPPLEFFQDSGRYYMLKDRMIWSMTYWYLDSLRIVTSRRTSRSDIEKWYQVERPRISDSLHAKCPGSYRRFEGELHFTNDTVWQWLGDMASFETCNSSATVAQLLKADHWYLFVFDTEGPTHTVGRSHYIERRVSFYVDFQGEVQHWQSVRRRMKKPRIV